MIRFMELFKNTNFDFLGKKWPFIIASLVLTVAGLGSMLARAGQIRDRFQRRRADVREIRGQAAGGEDSLGVEAPRSAGLRKFRR